MRFKGYHVRYIFIGSVIYICRLHLFMIPGVVLVDGCTEHKMSIWKEMAFEILEYI